MAKLTDLMVQMLREAEASGFDGISTQDDFTNEQHMAIKRLWDLGLIESETGPVRFMGNAVYTYTACMISESGREELDEIDSRREITASVDEHKNVIILIINLSVATGEVTEGEGEDIKAKVREADVGQTRNWFRRFSNVTATSSNVANLATFGRRLLEAFQG